MFNVKLVGDDEDDDDDDNDELSCGMVDQRKVFSLFSSRNHFQRSLMMMVAQTTAYVTLLPFCGLIIIF